MDNLMEVTMTSETIKRKVLECLSESYGVSGSLERLDGENLNYLLCPKAKTEQIKEFIKL